MDFQGLRISQGLSISLGVFGASRLTVGYIGKVLSPFIARIAGALPATATKHKSVVLLF